MKKEIQKTKKGGDMEIKEVHARDFAEVLSYQADGGCVLLYNETVALKLNNGYGDGSFNIYIVDDNRKIPTNYHFKKKWCSISTINVKEKLIVSSMDCEERLLKTLPKGEYHIYKNAFGTGSIMIVKYHTCNFYWSFPCTCSVASPEQ